MSPPFELLYHEPVLYLLAVAIFTGCMVGISANTRAIIVERQRLLESQTADVCASKRNAALLKDLESLLQTLQRKQHVRLAQEARAASAELGGRQRRMREAQAREALGLRAELAEVHCRREQAAEQFKEELELREAAARSKQQLRVELELERFDNATRGALRLGARAEISAAEDKVQVHTRLGLQHAAATPTLCTRHANARAPRGRTLWLLPWLKPPNRLKRPSKHRSNRRSVGSLMTCQRC